MKDKFKETDSGIGVTNCIRYYMHNSVQLLGGGGEGGGVTGLQIDCEYNYLLKIIKGIF